MSNWVMTAGAAALAMSAMIVARLLVGLGALIEAQPGRDDEDHRWTSIV